MFLLDGWLTVPLVDDILCFDKEGHQSETVTELDPEKSWTLIYYCNLLLVHYTTINLFYSSGSNLLFHFDISGELAFTNVQLPFKSLNIAGTKFKPMDIRAGYEFVLPLEQGRCVVAFNHCTIYYVKYATKMSSFDRFGRFIGSDIL